ncbi:phosphonate metabolism transcriptional regulator PhnF [Paracoccus suum]|uniref:phosphonate metabolism transcriptional regulator PhnF n=1 Tax=Paracoccus suum TaxID=2259340 RepID=UPI001F547CA6|nr:phosphonate metabolism transcriptional regulator PhnF [Paracoccus suum]
MTPDGGDFVDDSNKTGLAAKGGVAIWQAIAESLRADIAAGRFPAGQRLPSAEVLAARFGVHRHTVRQAIAALTAEGLTYSRRGAGVLVTAVPVDYPLGGRVSFRRNLALAGRLPGRRIAAIVTRPADPREAEALGLAPGALVHVANGASLADGAPIALFQSAFPAEALPDLPQALWREGSVSAAFAACGIPDWRRASTRIAAELADAAQAAQLGLPSGAPLLRTDAINIDHRDRPIEYGRSWFAGPRVVLTVGG